MFFVSHLLPPSSISCALKEPYMKMVVAIIRPERLHCLKRALKTVNAELVTVRGRTAHPDIRVHSSPGLRVEILTEDIDAEEVVDVVRQAAFPNGPNSTNDGRIFVVSLDHRRDFSDREREALPARAG
jgi:nitrogen regulatory protein PII